MKNKICSKLMLKAKLSFLRRRNLERKVKRKLLLKDKSLLKVLKQIKKYPKKVLKEKPSLLSKDRSLHLLKEKPLPKRNQKRL